MTERNTPVAAPGGKGSAPARDDGPAPAPVDGPAPSRDDGPAPARVVVGAAIVRDGRVLAACRSAPPEFAGGWEFPGGKVEPGEGEEQALVRECREELGVTVRPLRRVPGAWPLAKGFVLHVWLADLVDGEPAPLQDHSELRWLTAADFAGLAWLPQDREAAELVANAVRTGTGTRTGTGPEAGSKAGRQARSQAGGGAGTEAGPDAGPAARTASGNGTAAGAAGARGPAPG